MKNFISILGKRASVIINELVYFGNSINISSNGDIVIDGIVQKEKALQNINVVVNGNVDTVKTISGDIVVNGDVKGNCQTTSGDINAKVISGSCTSVSGDINT